jgi:hypothetical protein
MNWEEQWLRANTCFFPKHANEQWYDVIQRDRDYVEWLLENKEDAFSGDGVDAIAWGIKHVPDRI